MIEERDLDAAVAAGVIDAGQREALVGFVRAHRRGAAGPDEEQFRLLTGFNDIFVTIAIGLLLTAVALLAGPANAMVGSLGIAMTSWLLAEYFTRQRRMALPSIALLLAFVGSVFVAALVLASGGATMAFGGEGALPPRDRRCRGRRRRRRLGPLEPLHGADHRRRRGRGAHPARGRRDAGAPPRRRCGACRDRAVRPRDLRARHVFRRQRPRTGNAPHRCRLLAPPARRAADHPSGVRAIGLFTAGTVAGPGAAVSVLAVYLVLTVVALAIDRRALLVSGLLYVIYAVNALVTAGGSVGNTGAGFTVLLLGLFLVALSALWRPIRHRIIALLPGEIAQRLPAAA